MGKLIVATSLLLPLAVGGCVEMASEEESEWCLEEDDECFEDEDRDVDDGIFDRRARAEEEDAPGPDDSGEPLGSSALTPAVDEGVDPRADPRQRTLARDVFQTEQPDGEQGCTPCSFELGDDDDEAEDSEDSPVLPVPGVRLQTSLGAGPSHRPVHGFGSGGGSKLGIGSAVRRGSL